MTARAAYARSSYLEDAHNFLETITQHAKVQARRALGLGLMAAALFLTLACLTYHVEDPSLNTAAKTTAIQNWMGGPGALWADLWLQSVGVGVLPVIAFLAVFGAQLWRGQVTMPAPLRVILYLTLSVLAAAVAGARLPGFGFLPQPYLGGAMGMMGLNALAGWSQVYLGPWVHLAVAGLMVPVAFIAFALAVGITPRGALARLLAVALFLYGTVLQLWFLVYDRVQLWRNPEYVPDHDRLHHRARRIMEEDEDLELEDDTAYVDSDDAESEESAAPRTTSRRALSEIKVVRPKAAKSRRKASPKQMELGDVASDFALPDLDLLQDAPVLSDADKIDENALRKNADMLQTVLADYHVRGDIASIHPGPVVTLYELEPAPGTKSSRVIGLANDIARSMAALSVRAAVVPGRNVIGIEIPNKKRQTVYLRELLTSETYAASTAKLALVLGKDIGGHPVIADLARMPHLLVAGTTGSGKSVAINTMILSLLYRLTPAQCRFIMIDPKMLELSVYDDIPHLLSPVVTEPGKAVVALKWAVIEMENRYRAMSKLGVRNIEGYNARLAQARESGEVLTRKIQTGFDPENGQPVYEEQPLDLTELPYIVIIVDEFADLMLVAGKDVESAIQRLAQMARAAGIHLIMATQRPSVDVITGVIKANFPTRISFQVTSKIDSRTILQEGGAEQLLGMGDMLYMAAGGRLTRVHGPFVSDNEVEQVVAHLKAQGEPEYLDDVTDDTGEMGTGLFGEAEDPVGSSVDEVYDQAVALVAREGKASTSFVQRHLQIGYNRAARIIEEMEKQGIITEANHAGKREVLVGDHSGRH